MKELTDYILKFGDLNKQQTDFIASKATSVTLLKDEYFLEVGKIPMQVAFLLEGIFRFSYYSNKEEEITDYFIDEHQFITEYKKFEANVSASEYLQAVTDCKLLVFSKKDWDEISNTIVGWDTIVNKMFKKYLLDAIEKRSPLNLEDPITRYLLFLEKFPTLSNRVPLSYIASYLGITEESLIRIRENSN
nr:Crp/Fnr family transcriptional regulator [uncultured Flavobacterium sp.]